MALERLLIAPFAIAVAAADICVMACAMIPGSTRPTLILKIATATKISSSTLTSALC